MKIALTGGGTIGAVNPLLAIKDEIINQKISAEFVWIGTEGGIEKNLILKQKLDYCGITPVKLRRYFSWRNFFIPFLLIKAFVESWRVLRKIKPDIIVSAGGFVSVPVVWAGYFRGIKSVIHQQDLKPGLANRLMSPFASKITIAFPELAKFFPENKTVYIGNFARRIIFNGDKGRAMEKFHLDGASPVLFIMGGSLGSQFINSFIVETLPELIKFCQIIHVSGQKENTDIFREIENIYKSYHHRQYLYEDIADAYAASDLVMCRAGLSTLTELSALGKPAIVIPIPNHQQEKNAKYFSEKNAAIVLNQNELTRDRFVVLVKDLINNPARLKKLSENIRSILPSDADKKFVQIIRGLV